MRIATPMFLICLALPALPQQAPTDHHITLDVVVTDKSGKPVSGLQQSDFTVTDNKQPDKILSFQAMAAKTADPPVEIILLVDKVNTTTENASDVRQQLMKYLSQNGGQLALPTSMVFFSDLETILGKAPTTDSKALLADVDRNGVGLRTVTRNQSYSGSERLQLSLRALDSIAAAEQSKPGRKILIWMSPGWPILSGPNVVLTPKMQQDLFAAVVTTSTELIRARITVYSIDTQGAADAGNTSINYYRDFLKGVGAPKQVDPGNLALQVISAQSGGRLLTSNRDIGKQIDNCINEASSWYVLSIDSPAAEHPNEYHKLDIKMGKAGLTAHTRTGYYDQP